VSTLAQRCDLPSENLFPDSVLKDPEMLLLPSPVRGGQVQLQVQVAEPDHKQKLAAMRVYWQRVSVARS